MQDYSKFMLKSFYHTIIQNRENRIIQKYFHLGKSKMVCKF